MNTIKTLARKAIFVSLATALLVSAALLPTAARAEKDCTFQGKSYSDGAVEKMGDGNLKLCRDGHWI